MRIAERAAVRILSSRGWAPCSTAVETPAQREREVVCSIVGNGDAQLAVWPDAAVSVAINRCRWQVVSARPSTVPRKS